MPSHLGGFRGLWSELVNDEFVARRTLPDWLERNAELVDWLSAFGSRTGPEVPASRDELQTLFALEVVFDELTLPFQSGRADGSDWPGPALDLDEWIAFAEDVGLTVAHPERFSPFDCEIVHAQGSSDGSSPIEIVDEIWPTLWLGNLLIRRAGTSVRGGTTHLNPRIANASTLYWATRRKHRPTNSLWDGWGSNSRWRTNFRRDYRVGDSLFFNVDGDVDIRPDTPVVDMKEDDANDDLSRTQRIELLTHRGFVRTDLPHNDLYPYDDTFTCTESEVS